MNRINLSAYLFFLNCFLYVPELSSKIIECFSAVEIISHIAEQCDKKTLIIFDIDNTLLQPEGFFGTNEWFDVLIKRKIAEGHTPSDALAIAAEANTHVHFQLPMVPVEQEMISLVRRAQQSGAYVVGLTARSHQLAHRTHDLLTHIGMPLHHAALAIEISDADDDIVYHGGIVFCSSYHKVERFLKLLRDNGHAFDRIICIDDRRKYLEIFDTHFADSTTEFIGIRYGYLDEKCRAFSWELAECECEHEHIRASVRHIIG